MFYENYLNSLNADVSFIPESASISDASIFTERAIQDIFNETFIGLAMQEMTMFNTLNEADGDAPAASPEVKKTKLEAVKKFFATIWSKIKGFFAKIIDAVKGVFTKFKREKGDQLIKDFYASCKAIKDDKEGKVAEGLKFTLYEVGTGKKLKDEQAKKYDKLANEAKEAAKKAAKVAAGQDVFAGTFATDEFLNATKEALKAIKPKENATFDDVYAARDDIAFYTGKANSIIDPVKNGYNDAKNTIDKAMSDAKDVVNKNGNISQFTQAIAKISSTLTKVQSAFTSKTKELRNNYISAMGKVVVAGKRLAKKAAVGEHTEITINTDADAEEKKDDTTVEVKDEIEEAFAALREDDDVEITINADGEDKEDDDAPFEESALYNAIVRTYTW